MYNRPMISTEDSTHIALMLVAVYKCLMYMLSTEDSTTHPQMYETLMLVRLSISARLMYRPMLSTEDSDEHVTLMLTGVWCLSVFNEML